MLDFLNSSVFTNARLSRWSILLQQYSFTVSYCRGRDNVIADFHSRNPGGRFYKQTPQHLLVSRVKRCLPPTRDKRDPGVLVLINRISSAPELNSILRDVRTYQRDDAQCQRYRERHVADLHDSLYQVNDELLFVGNRIGDRWRLVIPEKLVYTLTEVCHDLIGHAGFSKLLHI